MNRICTILKYQYVSEWFMVQHFSFVKEFLLLTPMNYYLSIDKLTTYILKRGVIQCSSISRVQPLNYSNGTDKLFYPTFRNECKYVFMFGLKFIHVSERGPGEKATAMINSKHQPYTPFCEFDWHVYIRQKTSSRSYYPFWMKYL